MAVVGEAFVRIRPQGGTFVAETTEQVKGGLGKISNLLGLGLAIGVGEVLKKSLEVADQFEKSEARLKTAIRNTGGQFDEYRGQIDKANSAGLRLGLSNARVENVLAQLTLRTGDAHKAFRDLGVVEDVAAGLGKDVESSLVLIAKAEAGSSSALKRLGINFTSTGDKAKDADAIMKLLGERFAGAAKDQAETFAGKMAALRAEIGNVEQKIGLALIPVLETLGSTIADGINFVSRHRKEFEILGVVIGAVLTPIVYNYIKAQAIATGESVINGIVKIAAAWGLVTVAEGEAAAGATASAGAGVAAGAAGAAGKVALTGLGSAAAAAAAPVAAVGAAFVGAALLSKHFADQDNKHRADFVANAIKRGDAEHEIQQRILADNKIVADAKKDLGHADASRTFDAEQDAKKLHKTLSELHAKRVAEEKETKTAVEAVTTATGQAIDSAVLFGVKLSEVTDKKELDALTKRAEKLTTEIEGYFAKGDTAIADFVKSSDESVKTLGGALLQQTRDDARFAQDLLQLVEHGIKGPLLDQLEQMGSAGLPAADKLVAGLSSGLTAKQAQVAAATKIIADTVANEIKKVDDGVETLGQDITAGLIRGMTDPKLIAALISKTSYVIDTVKDAGRARAKAQSPSRLFAEELGIPITQGILVGMEEGLSGRHGGAAVIDRIKHRLGGIGGSGGGGGGGVLIQPGAVQVRIGAGATAGSVRDAAKHFEGALSRVMVKARMGTGARG